MLVLALDRERGDHVVGLVALGLQRRHRSAARTSRIRSTWPRKSVGRLLAGGLVVGEGVGAEGVPPDVEGHPDVGRRLVAQDVDQHRGEAVDGVRRLTGRGGEVLDRQREERSIGQRVAVEEQQPRSRASTCRLAPAGMAAS